MVPVRVGHQHAEQSAAVVAAGVELLAGGAGRLVRGALHPREGRDDLIDVHAVLYVERASQKGIVIGKGGGRLREVGTSARGQIEKLLGTKVYLDLRVKVAKNWQTDPKQLGRLGF